MSLYDSIFGTGDQVKTTQQTNASYEAAKPYIMQILNAGQQQFQGPGFQTPQQAVDLSNQAIGSLTGAAENITGNVPQYQQTLSNLMNISPQSNPAFQNYLNASNDAIVRAWQQGVMPAITDQAVAAGGVGGSRQGVAQGIAAQGLANSLQQNSAQLTNQAYGQSLQAALQALGLAPSINTLPLAAAPAYSQAADISTNLANRDILNQNRNLQNYINTVQPFVYGTSSTAKETIPGQTLSPGQVALGAGSIAASYYGGKH